MPLTTLILLALIQGVTEFLPVSSSGHLALFPALTAGPDQGLLLDVAVHVGTLAAVLIYFRAEVGRAALGGVHVLTGRLATPEARLALMLALATVPVVLAGLALHAADMTGIFRNVEVIAWAMIGFGLVLWAADRWGPQTRTAEGWTWGHAALMGLAQALALIPGTSRSGITMTAARALGYARTEAARLALLMSIPTLAAAGLLAGRDLTASGDPVLRADAALAAGLSCLAALAAVHLMMRMFRTWSMTPFVIYRLALGAALLVWVHA